jgi:hypothetical protein
MFLEPLDRNNPISEPGGHKRSPGANSNCLTHTVEAVALRLDLASLMNEGCCAPVAAVGGGSRQDQNKFVKADPPNEFE